MMVIGTIASQLMKRRTHIDLKSGVTLKHGDAVAFGVQDAHHTLMLTEMEFVGTGRAGRVTLSLPYRLKPGDPIYR